MKKVDVSFVCDCCGVTLPQEFVRKNQNGNLYFDRAAYNQVRMGAGCWLHWLKQPAEGVQHGS